MSRSLAIRSSWLAAAMLFTFAVLALAAPPANAISTSATTTAVTSSVGSPSFVGQMFSVNVQVSSAGGTPSGSVLLSLSGAGTPFSQSLTLDGHGAAVFPFTPTTAGAYTFTAAYPGGGGLDPSTGTLTQNVVKYPSTITLSPSENPIHVGASGTMTVTVTSTGGGTPTGDLTLAHTGSIASSSTFALLNGAESFGMDTSFADTTVYTATYAGDATHEAATSAPLTVPVIKYATTLSLVVSPSALRVGDSGGTVTITASSTGGGTPTGTVSFTQTGGVAVGPTIGLTGGTAVFAIGTTIADTLIFSATYNGDAAHDVATAATQYAVVSPVAAAATTTTLAASADPSIAGTSVTFTARVSAASGQPTGSVHFYDETGTTLGSATLASGAATLATSSLTVGLHTITAVYDGSAATWARSLASLVQGVNSPTTALSSSANPSFVNDPVTITVQIPSVGGVAATGSVQLSLATTVGVAFSQSLPLVNGAASLGQQFPAEGVYQFTASYAGDGSHPARTDTLIQLVNRHPTTLTISASLSPVHVGEQLLVTFTAASTGGGTPTGTVSFTQTGGVAVGPTISLTGGAAVYPVTTNFTDTLVFNATYNGDATHAPATASALTVEVVKYPSTITLSVSPAAVHVGGAITVTMQVSSTSGTPTGSVMLTQTGGIAISSPFALDASGTASFAPDTSNAGTYTFSASYPGDASHAAATSGTVIIDVTLPATTTTVTSSLAPSQFGDAVTFTATVTTAVGSPTGSVQFSVDGAVGPTRPLSGGTASFTISTLSVGAHTITAVYSGDTTFTGSTGTLAQTVNKASQTITFAPLAGKTYGDADFAVNGTASSGLGVTFTASGDCSISTAMIHITAAGQCTVVAAQAGDATYDAAPSVTRTFGIQPAPLTISANDKTRRYGAPAPVFDATTAGFVNGDGVSVLTGVLACVSPSTAASPVGAYPITCSGQTATNYTVGYAPGTLTITKAATMIHVSDIGVVYGATSATAIATVTSQSPSTATVGEGAVTYTLRSGPTVLATASAQIAAGSGTATITLPAGTLIGGYELDAHYSGGTDFASSDTTATLAVACPTAVRFPMPVPGSDEAEVLWATIQGTTGANGPFCDVAFQLVIGRHVVGHGTFLADFPSPGVMTISLGTITMGDDGARPTLFTGTVTRAGATGTVTVTFTNTKSGKSRTTTIRFSETAAGTFVVVRPGAGKVEDSKRD